MTYDPVDADDDGTVESDVDNNNMTTGTLDTVDLSTGVGSRVTGSSSDQTITADGGIQTVEFDTTIYDRNSDYDTANNQFVAPFDGLYHISSVLQFLNAASGDELTHRIVVNGTGEFRNTVYASGNSTESTQASTVVQLDSGDTISISATAESDTDVNVDFNDSLSCATYSLIG